MNTHEPPGAHFGDPDDCEWCRWFFSPRELEPQRSFPPAPEPEPEKVKP